MPSSCNVVKVIVGSCTCYGGGGVIWGLLGECVMVHTVVLAALVAPVIYFITAIAPPDVTLWPVDLCTLLSQREIYFSPTPAPLLLLLLLLAMNFSYGIEQEVLPLVLRMASDPVPNIRFNVSKTLEKMAPRLEVRKVSVFVLRVVCVYFLYSWYFVRFCFPLKRPKRRLGWHRLKIRQSVASCCSSFCVCFNMHFISSILQR